jgi:hypothetical protein
MKNINNFLEKGWRHMKFDGVDVQFLEIDLKIPFLNVHAVGK